MNYWEHQARDLFSLLAKTEAGRDALKERVAEMEKFVSDERKLVADEQAYFNGLQARLRDAESSLAASRRQVEGLRSTLRIAHEYVDTHGRIAGKLTPLAFEVLRNLQSAVILDAPQPEARSKAIIDDAELPVKGGSISGPAVDAWNNRSDDARDAIIAEAVEVMRTLSPIKDVPIFRDEEPVVLRVGNFGEYVYMPLGTWSIFRAARAFVEKHGGGR